MSEQRAERDLFLRNVIQKLHDTNVRWPGLWTRLESLMSERDSLEACIERLRKALMEISDYGDSNHADPGYEAWARERAIQALGEDS